MNQFCGMKGIKKEFSVARTPQQNRVAERKNRNLTEAARTMLADSLLPTTFWAESVNTACYVQNRVLVTYPHNKTLYELLHGSGLDWLFDIDLLTNSMNYEPVTAGNQTNRNAGIKDNVDAVPTQQYILLPLLYDSPQRSNDAVADDAGKKTNEELANKGERNGQEKEGGASNKEGDKNVQDFRAELDNLLVQQKEGTDIVKISRKRSKLDKHGRGNRIECAKARRILSRSTKVKPWSTKVNHKKSKPKNSKSVP
ncbi:putative ribonuclease H-like domain-containing protein [Tanacetum coccineum]